MHRIDAPGATSENLFTRGSPSAGIPATEVSDHWLNAVQEEIANVIAAANIELLESDTDTRDQLVTAITQMIADVAVDQLEFASDVEESAWTIRNRASTPGGIAHAFTAAATLGNQGVYELPNGIIVQWGRGTVSSGTTNQLRNENFNIAFPNAVWAVYMSNQGINRADTANGPRCAPQYDSANNNLTRFAFLHSANAATTIPYRWWAIGN